MYIYIYIHIIYIYIYIYTQLYVYNIHCLLSLLVVVRWRDLSNATCLVRPHPRAREPAKILGSTTPNSHHKIRVFRTQPLENMRAAVKLPIKQQRFPGSPTLGKSILVGKNIVMGTGCTAIFQTKNCQTKNL